MVDAPKSERDPHQYTVLLTALFAAVCMVRLTIPSELYFDEVHYVPAARALLEGSVYINREHPLLGKEMIALGIALFGDNALGWRVMPLIAGIVCFYAVMRTMWFASGTAIATGLFGVLLGTGFMLFIHTRLAMLDIFMVAAIACAAWQFTASLRAPETARWRIVLCGIALGLAMAAKWSAAVLAMVPGITFFICRLRAERARLWTSKRGAPMPGVSLLEAAIWLGAVPLLVYAATFLPALFLEDSLLRANGLIGLHREMLDLQSQTLKPHPYQSLLPDWLLNLRGIWYLYENIDGAQRGVLLIGNPLTMLLGLPALAWCAWSGYRERDWTQLAMVIGFGLSLALWLAPIKSVQFYYHYLLPSFFLLAALALVLERLWRAQQHKLVIAVVGISCALFAYFFPILSAAELSDEQAFLNYAWIEGWR